jgi:hypothetical protein
MPLRFGNFDGEPASAGGTLGIDDAISSAPAVPNINPRPQRTTIQLPWRPTTSVTASRPLISVATIKRRIAIERDVLTISPIAAPM